MATPTNPAPSSEIPAVVPSVVEPLPEGVKLSKENLEFALAMISLGPVMIAEYRGEGQEVIKYTNKKTGAAEQFTKHALAGVLSRALAGFSAGFCRCSGLALILSSALAGVLAGALASALAGVLARAMEPLHLPGLLLDALPMLRLPKAGRLALRVSAFSCGAQFATIAGSFYYRGRPCLFSVFEPAIAAILKRRL